MRQHALKYSPFKYGWMSQDGRQARAGQIHGFTGSKLWDHVKHKAMSEGQHKMTSLLDSLATTVR